MSGYLQRMLKAAGQNAPAMQPILEINPEHAREAAECRQRRFRRLVPSAVRPSAARRGRHARRPGKLREADQRAAAVARRVSTRMRFDGGQAGWRETPRPGCTLDQRDWLTRGGSLTAHLARLGRVNVRVTREVDCPWFDEPDALASAPRAPMWVREVILSVDGTPFVAAPASRRSRPARCGRRCGGCATAGGAAVQRSAGRAFGARQPARDRRPSAVCAGDPCA